MAGSQCSLVDTQRDTRIDLDSILVLFVLGSCIWLQNVIIILVLWEVYFELAFMLFVQKNVATLHFRLFVHFLNIQIQE